MPQKYHSSQNLIPDVAVLIHVGGGGSGLVGLSKSFRSCDALSANEIAAQKGSLSKTYLGRELGCSSSFYALWCKITAWRRCGISRARGSHDIAAYHRHSVRLATRIRGFH